MTAKATKNSTGTLVQAKHPLLRFRLRTTLVVPFLLQTGAAIGLVGYLSFQAGQKAVNDLSSQLRTEITARIERELQGYFDIPPQLNQINAASFEDGQMDLDHGGSAPQFLQQMKISSFLYGVYCGDASGNFLSIARNLDPKAGRELELLAVNSKTNYKMAVYSFDKRGKRQLEIDNYGAYDPRIRPWYEAAIRDKKPTWSEIYLDFPSLLPTITSSRPIYDETGLNVVGVCATDVLVTDDLRGFLANLKIGKTGQAFIIDRSGQIISSSTDDPLTDGDGEDAQLIQAVDSANPLTSQSAQFLQQRFGNLNTIQAAYQLEFKVDGQRQFMQVLPFQAGKGLDWLIVVTVPEADFMDRIYANTRNTIWLTLIALGIAMGCSILTARAITRPILNIATASGAMAQGDLDQQVKEDSPIIEVGTLAHSFNTMAEQLKASFSTLEHKNEALRIAEENFRSIFENALEGIFQSSPEGRFLSVNSALAQIYGYGSPQEMIEQITDISHQLYVDPERRTEFKELLNQQNFVKDFEYRCYCKDGSIIWTQIDARSVKDKNGKLLYYEGIVQDISDRKRREDELRRQLEDLQIEIDQKRREEEVNTFTTSTYFQEVQQEISEVNLDEFWS